MYKRGTVLRITTNGRLRRGDYVTVQRDYSSKEREQKKRIECANLEGSSWMVSPEDVESVEVRGCLYRKGDKAVIITRGGRFSKGAEVEISHDYSLSELEKGSSVRVLDSASNSKSVEYVSPHHLTRR